MLKYFIIYLLINIPSGIWGQLNKDLVRQQEPSQLPRAFMIGEHEKMYESMMGRYDKPLLYLYQNDLQKAFQAWMGVLMDMEEYARKTSFDLNGLKLWINIFLNEDGSIQHIVYFPKPNSRNMPFEKLSQFLNQFIDTYRFKDPVNIKCSHFGSVSFPTFAKREE